jgi:hypothetical protein
VAWKDEIRPQFRPDADNFLDQTAIFSTGVARDAGLPGAGATIDNLDNIPIDAVSSFPPPSYMRRTWSLSPAAGIAVAHPDYEPVASPPD